MITIHQRHRQTDRQTNGRHAIPRPRICTKVHCAVKNVIASASADNPLRYLVTPLSVTTCSSLRCQHKLRGVYPLTIKALFPSLSSSLPFPPLSPFPFCPSPSHPSHNHPLPSLYSVLIRAEESKFLHIFLSFWVF